MKVVGIILIVFGIFSIPESLAVLLSNEALGYKLGYILPTILCFYGGALFIKLSINKQK